MPSESKSQQRLMAAAEHGADFPMANKLRQSMSHNQLHDFASGSMANKPEHVAVAGGSRDVMDSNTSTFKQKGMNEFQAVKASIKTARPYNNSHKRLGKYLHPRKDGKAHGS